MARSSQTEELSASGEVQGFDLVGHKGTQYPLWTFLLWRLKPEVSKANAGFLRSSWLQAFTGLTSVTRPKGKAKWTVALFIVSNLGFEQKI